MALESRIGDKMESEFSDPDSVGEYHSLLTNTIAQSPIIGNRYSSMTFEIDKPQNTDPDPSKQSLGLAAIGRYPKGVFFCLGNEFSERFSYYGMRAILTLYLITVHDMDASNAKLLFHAFVSLAYFTPVFGSILADGFLGRYRVILYISLCYCLGHLLLTGGAVTAVGSTAMIVLDFTGLFIIALSTGGIKPCVVAFAADQFPDHMRDERKQFFSFFYFSINSGALLSKIITPILRRHHCLGADHCFPLAFGIPAIFMFLATFVFWAGTRFYTVVPRKENVIVRVCQCVVYALRQRANRPENEITNKHWLDYARPKYSQVLIDDIKTIIRIVVLYIPVVFFWSLFDQLGSTWVLQANDMNGRVGPLTLLPDQMPVLNPFLIIVMVPILEGVIYPILGKCHFLVRPLRRMGWGGILAAISFAMAGFLQLKVDTTKIVLPQAGFGRLVVISCVEEEVSLSGGTYNLTIPPHDTSRYTLDSSRNITLTLDGPHGQLSSLVPIQKGHGTLVVIFHPSPEFPMINYDLKKAPNGKTRLYVIFENQLLESIHFPVITIRQAGHAKGEISNLTSYLDLEPELWGSNIYDIYLKSCPNNSMNTNCTWTYLQKYTAETGAVDVVILRSNGSVRQVELISANTVSVLWQIPQYLVITLGEALFSITGLEFSYSEASPSMKSVLMAIWSLTTAFGNIVDMIISGSGMMKDNPAGEFFIYSALMTAVMLIFIALAYRYKSALDHGRRRTVSNDEGNDPLKINPSTKVLTELG